MRFFLSNSWQRLKKWTLHFAATPYADLVLFITAFLEASVFLLPPDLLIVAMTLMNKEKWQRCFVIATVGSVSGAFLGYLIGWGFYESIGRHLVQTYGFQESMAYIGLKFKENAFVAIFAASLTPVIPFKAITISAGVFRVPLAELFFVSLFGRGMRYFFIAYLVARFGERARVFIRRYFWIVSLLVALIVALFWWFLIK